MQQPRAGIERETRTDYLKAAAIFGVVYIHAEGAFSGFFRFCVPVFIGLWAFYYECGLARRDRAVHAVYVYDRFVRLLVPYLFWTLIYLSIYYTAADFQEMPWHTIVGGMFGGYGWAGQYFFHHSLSVDALDARAAEMGKQILGLVRHCGGIARQRGD